MAQGTPNPIELYEAAVQKMTPIVAGIRSDQLGGDTPCSEWNVQALLMHNIKVAQFVHQLVTGSAQASVMDAMAVSGPLPSEGAEAAFVSGTNQALQALKAAGALDKMVSPFGEPIPLGSFLMMPFADLVIHKWDLAKATGQDISIDAGLTEAAYHPVSHSVEAARQGGFFGPEVQVPISASVQDKLLGMSGRKP